MHPYIRIFGLTLQSYFAMSILSYFVSLVVVTVHIRRAGLERKTAWAFIVCSIVGGMIGTRLFYIAAHLQDFIREPALLRNIIVSGFDFYGALYGGLVAGLLYAKKAKKPFLYLADNLMFVLPLGHAIRKVGCFLGGCCFGTQTSCAIGRLFNAAAPNTLANRHPVQLYESAVNFVLFTVFFLILKSRARTGMALAIYLILYGIGRFITDFFRSGLPLVVFGLSFSQVASILTVALGMIILIRTQQNKEEIQ